MTARSVLTTSTICDEWKELQAFKEVLVNLKTCFLEMRTLSEGAWVEESMQVGA